MLTTSYVVVAFIIAGLTLTGCGHKTTPEEEAFFDACAAAPGCKYNVWKQSCVCDNTKTYIKQP